MASVSLKHETRVHLDRIKQLFQTKTAATTLVQVFVAKSPLPTDIGLRHFTVRTGMELASSMQDQADINIQTNKAKDAIIQN